MLPITEFSRRNARNNVRLFPASLSRDYFSFIRAPPLFFPALITPPCRGAGGFDDRMRGQDDEIGYMLTDSAR